MTPELAALLEELEIRTIPINERRGSMETMAIGSMEKILRQYGYAHLKMVLMSICETANNRRELVAPVILAVSDLICAHPQWAARASEWFTAFDKVSLGRLWFLAKANRKAAPLRSAIATMLFNHLLEEDFGL